MSVASALIICSKKLVLQKSTQLVHLYVFESIELLVEDPSEKATNSSKRRKV